MAEISDYLKDLNEQVVQEDSQLLVAENPVVEQLCGILENLIKVPRITVPYISAAEATNGLVYTAEDIKDFSLQLKIFERYKEFPAWAGHFLSALINYSKEENYEVITEHLSKKLIYFGHYNEKNVTVKGSLGFGAGTLMTKGTLLVKGNVGDQPGRNLQGGKIIIKGSAGNTVGYESYGGEIHIKGKIGYVHSSCIAKVYQEGIIVWSR